MISPAIAVEIPTGLKAFWNDASQQAIDTLTETSNATNISFPSLKNINPKQFGNAILAGIGREIDLRIQSWLDAHPVVAWAIAHPLITLAIAVLIIFIFWGLLRAIARLFDELWLRILRSPLWLGQLVWNGGKSLTARAMVKPNNTALHQQRKTEILTRLETLRLEQNQLLQELETLFAPEE
jgi:hypothetical protein